MAPELFSTLPTRALAIYAHPDDPEISCGGTLAAWAAEGAAVHALTCTRGDKGSPDPATDPDELSALRADEITAAARVLGLAGHEQLDIDDGEIENTAPVRALIVAAIRRVRPDVVVCPDPTAVIFGDTYFNHRDHRMVGWAALDAVAPAAGNPLYFPDAGPPHPVPVVLLSGTLAPNVWVDVASALDTKVAALACHRTQLGSEGEEWLRAVIMARAEDDGRAGGTNLAEGFRRLTLG